MVMIARMGVVFVVMCFGQKAWAWGERGHDLVTRVAARILIHDRAEHPNLAKPFVHKEHMLAHLSNVPDFHWRSPGNVGKEVTKINGPTHYIDIDYLTVDNTFASVPMTVNDAEKKMAELCEKMPEGYVCPAADKKPKIEKAGSAVWRIQQFMTLMKNGFAKAKGDKKLVAKAVDEALLMGGLGAHFVGDLGNPYHTTRDYDGWESGAGGIHGYFETDIVNSYDLTLDQEVLQYALSQRPADRLSAQLPKDMKRKTTPQDIAVALTLDSFSRLSVIANLDKKHAMVKPSKVDKGMKLEAERKDPHAVNKHFRAIAVERLAVAADVLSRLWKGAWVEAGKPDLSGYHSYTYPLAPDFVPPDYQ